MSDSSIRIGVAGIALSIALLSIGGLVLDGFVMQPAAGGVSVSGAPPSGGQARSAGSVAANPAAGDFRIKDTLAEIPADLWLGAPDGGLSGARLRGRPVLLEFWTYLCYNCKNVEGWMKDTYRTYGPEGLQVIGVHTPEFDVERKVENVKDYVAKNGIEYPVAIDNGMKVWRRYNATNAWPAFLVYDRQGELVYRQAGERAVLGAEEAIRKALDEEPAGSGAAAAAPGMTVMTQATRTTPSAAVLTVTFRPASGYLLVKSPPNEIRLDSVAGVTTDPNPALLGEPFRGADARDVRYFEGEASLEVPVALAPAFAGQEVELSGSIVYHVCDRETDVCARQQQSFTQVVAAD
jgi:hypothetical protein